MADSPSSIVTVTAVYTATQSTSLITVTPTSTSPPSSSNSSGGPAIAPIVGGAVGGLVGLLALAGVLWLCLRRSTKARLDGIFEDSIDTHNVPPVRSRRSESEHAPLDANRTYARPGVSPTPQTVSQNPAMSQMQYPQRVTGAPPVSGYWVYHPEPQPPLTSPNATSPRPLSSASSTIPLRNDEAQFVPHHTNSHSMSSADTHQLLPRHTSFSSSGTGPYHERHLSAGSGGSGSAPYNPYTDFAPPSGGSRQSSSDQRQAQPLYLTNHAAVSASSVVTPTLLPPSTSSKTVPPPPQQTQPRPTRVVVHDDFGSLDAQAGFGASSSSADASSSAPMSTPTPNIPGDEPPPAYF